jgi:hypothetical protein
VTLVIAWLWAALQLFDGATDSPKYVAPSGLTISARSCVPCHADVVAEWRQSAHADAFVDPLFAASFKYERRKWCVDCHAPLSERAAGRLRDEGVGCAACHLRDGAIVAARPPTAAAQEAHPILVEPRLLRAELCAGCHQFNWPITTEPLRYGPHPMQNTFAEWQHSGSAQTCIGCHMNDGHRMTGGHDLERVRNALDVSVERPSPSLVRVVLRSRNVGHALPTGDPFRRLVLQLCASPSCTPQLNEIFFGRRFDGNDHGRLIADTSVPAKGERRVELRAPGGAMFWRLVYRYAAIGTERDLDDDEREQEIGNGRIGGGS